MGGAISQVDVILANDPKAITLQQFENPNNPAIHKKTTALEILHDMDRDVDIFVAAVGTGGTITGTATILKQELLNIQVIAVEPTDSPVLSGGNAGPHKIQGIGAGFVPKVLDTNIYDEIIQVSNDQAIQTARDLMKKEGLFVGISAGANVYAALEVAKRPENKGKKIVTILCDTAERYLSTELFDQE